MIPVESGKKEGVGGGSLWMLVVGEAQVGGLGINGGKKLGGNQISLKRESEASPLQSQNSIRTFPGEVYKNS